MIGQSGVFGSAWSLFRDPVSAEKRALLVERWAELDETLKFPGQGLGQKATGCGATIGVQPRCDFSCTGCYLGAEANSIPALPLERVFEQLDQLRAWLGPKSNVQITDGEVTLRPIEQLIAILRYARSIGMVPMVMTHGDHLRRQTGLLERLMLDANLTEISIHIDITQRGRDGYRAPSSELDLMPLRDEFASMIRAARRSTRRRLRAAMTLTVSSDNLPQIAEVVRWTIVNRDAFSLLSLQPLAQVGRTRTHLQGVTSDALWHEITRATSERGADLSRNGPIHFGHSECTRIVPLIAIQRRNQPATLMPLMRENSDDLRVMREFFSRGLGGVAFRDDRPIEMIGRAAGLIRRAPGWFLNDVRRWASRRLEQEAGVSLLSLLVALAIGSACVDGITLTSHHFMTPDELTTPTGQARLAACVFRVPHAGRMVPMCEMNATPLRETVYAERPSG